MNRLSPDQVLATPAGELAALQSDALFQLKSDATDLLSAAKAIVEHIDRALELKYADRAHAHRLTRRAVADWLRDAMDLALLTSQRPGDVLRMTRQDIHDGCLWVRQGKTGQRVGIEVQGELARVLKRLGARQVASIYLVNDNGQPVTIWKLDHAFRAACTAAGHDWQFRDLRAKAVTDEKDLRTAQRRAGHASEVTTAEI